MKKLKSLLRKFYLAAFFALSSASLALAQSNYYPPSALPATDTSMGGYGDACVGIATMIREGKLTLRQVPCFIKYFSQTLIAIAGSVAVIFVMVGGYRYVLGADEAKDEAKRTITYALIGLAVTLLAWIMVDIVLQFVTE